MKNIIETVDRKLDHLMWALIINGIILVLLTVLIVTYELLLQIIVAVAVLVVAYSFFYGSYKIYGIKKLIK